MQSDDSTLVADPLWYQKAVIYQVNVRSFFDGNGDGIGDFRGLTSKLDYLQQLGVSALWIMPFYPSPLRDDGYDISDYMSVNPIYGDIEDVRDFIREAHRRGLRVITELIINHTSDQHPWFQAARKAPKGSPERDFYVWSDTTEKYTDARIIFKDFEPSNWSWDEVAEQYYWHRFFHHQPDLNYDNPAVHEAVFQIMDYWLEMGVDGFRLDAIPYLYEREGTTGENLPETHAFLKQLRARIDAKYQDKMLLAEANQWPEDTRPYFGEGDECHMNYNFPIMPRLYMAVQMADRFPIIDILEQTPEIPAGCQWAMFLRNHDELTLEMVTEEERDYMWRTYSPNPRGRINLGIRRRIFPLFEGDTARVRLLHSLLLSMPGTPVLYYGDEIGMGDNIWMEDRFGVRTPMQWSDDVNAGFSTANPQQLLLPVIEDPQYCPAVVNVELQESNPNSQLHWMRKALGVRNQHPVFGRGQAQFLSPANQQVLAYTSTDAMESVLVVANLSGNLQSVELDLSQYAGVSPRDLLTGSALRAVGREPYPLTLAPYDCYWLQLRSVPTVPTVRTAGNWQQLFLQPTDRVGLNAALAEVLSGPAYANRPLTSAALLDAIEISDAVLLTLIEARANGMEPTTFLLALRAEVEPLGEPLLQVVAADQVVGLASAHSDPALARALFDIADGNSVVTAQTAWVGELFSGRLPAIEQFELIAGQSTNSNFNLADKLVLKVFRRATPDPQPEVELGRYLAQSAPGVHAPKLRAAVFHRDATGRERTVAVVHDHIENRGSAWDDFANRLLRHLENPQDSSITESALNAAKLLGGRVAQFHNSMVAAADPALSPTSFTSHYQRSIFATVRSTVRRAMLQLSAAELTGDARNYADRLLAREADIYARLVAVKDARIDALRIRIHGALHLVNVLAVGDDFQLIDFEGDTSRHLSERRLKLSPWRDVATLLQAIDHVAGWVISESSAVDRDAALAWATRMEASCLAGYRAAASVALLPEEPAHGELLLDAFWLERDAAVLSVVLAGYPDLAAGALSTMLVRTQ